MKSQYCDNIISNAVVLPKINPCFEWAIDIDTLEKLSDFDGLAQGVENFQRDISYQVFLAVLEPGLPPPRRWE